MRSLFLKRTGAERRNIRLIRPLASMCMKFNEIIRVNMLKQKIHFPHRPESTKGSKSVYREEKKRKEIVIRFLDFPFIKKKYKKNI